jgi:hypothetical protein
VSCSNNLAPFAIDNILQMASVALQNLRIVVFYDTQGDPYARIAACKPARRFAKLH